MQNGMVVFNEYNKTFEGLVDLSRVVRFYATAPPQKLHAMEEVYLQSNQIYTDIERKKIKYFREAFTYKFHLAALHLEEIWSLTHIGDSSPKLNDVLRNIFDLHEFTGDDILLHSFAFEGLILQSTAFLDFYMLYICAIFQISKTNRLNADKFIKSLEEVTEDTHKGKAMQVKSYFEENVFGDGTDQSNNWGKLLRELRNSIVHRDALFPDFENDEMLLEKIIRKWPEKEFELTCSSFCQDVQNAMFYQITKLAAIVYGLEWKPGPYKKNMW